MNADLHVWPCLSYLTGVLIKELNKIKEYLKGIVTVCLAAGNNNNNNKIPPKLVKQLWNLFYVIGKSGVGQAFVRQL